MGKIMFNGVDYSSPTSSGVSGVKGNAETKYRTGNVNITPEDIGIKVDSALSSSSTNPVQNKAIAAELTNYVKTMEFICNISAGSDSASKIGVSKYPEVLLVIKDGTATIRGTLTIPARYYYSNNNPSQIIGPKEGSTDAIGLAFGSGCIIIYNYYSSYTIDVFGR